MKSYSDTNKTFCFSNAILASYLTLLVKYQNTPQYQEFITKLGKSDKWLKNKTIWHDEAFHTKFHQALKDCFPEEKDLSFRAAQAAFSSRKIQLFSSLVGLLIDPKVIWSKIPSIASRMNTYNTFGFQINAEQVNFTRGIFTQYYGNPRDPEYSLINAELCQASRGSGLGILQATGNRLISLKETKCVQRGDDFCEYEYVWFKRSTLTNALLTLPLFATSFWACWQLPLDPWIRVLFALTFFEAVRGIHYRWRHSRSLQEAFDYQQKTLIDLRNTSVEKELLGQQLLEYQNQLSESIQLAALGEESFQFVHDLASPLMLLTLYSEQMQAEVKSKYPDEKDLTRYTKSISDVTARMKRLQGLFRLAAKGGESSIPTKVDLQKVIQDILNLYQPFFQRSGITTSLLFRTDSACIDTFDGLIESVLVNILQNAIKALTNADTRNIDIELTESEDSRGHLVLSIRDTGPGISTERQKQLWTRFGPTRGGTGFGLYSIKRMVESMKGTIVVQSSSTGTSFKITLPKHQKTSEPKGQKAAA